MNVPNLIAIDTESINIDGTDWVPSGLRHRASFAGRQPDGVKGCPMGRSSESAADAVRDLCYRTNTESGTNFMSSDFVAE